VQNKMRIALLAAAAFFAAPGLASASPPQNDNYLASLPIESAEFTTTVDTTEATTQNDLWNPSRDGQPLGGYVAETTNCKGTTFGHTVWYDLAPKAGGYAQIKAAAAFPTVVSVYEWGADSKIKRLVNCGSGGLDGLTVSFAGKRNYTIQVGGAPDAGGPIALSVDSFFDSDGDGELDPLDDCPALPGIHAAAGCPPKLPVVPALRFAPAGGGLRITGLAVDSVPKGAKLKVKCRGCGSQTVKARKQGRVQFRKLAGKVVPAGTKIELRVTLGRTGKGKYKHGAYGAYFAWPVKANGLGRRVTRCIAVGSSKLQRCK
jgi:hypothetical protein